MDGDRESSGPAAPMRIALVTRRFPPLIGGAETMLRTLATALADAGAEVTVLTSRLGGTPADEWIGAAPLGTPTPGRPNVRVVRLATSPIRFVGTFLYMGNLRRWFIRNRVDIVYVSMMKHDAYVALGAGRRQGFPVVLRPEGAGATGDVAWQAWGRGGRTIASRCKRADAFVAISSAVRGELVAAGYDPVRIVDVPNGVPVPERAWSPRPGWRDAPRAVFVGRLAAEKGLGSLVEAWPIVRRSIAGAMLTLVGEGPERAALQAAVVRLGLGASVALPGASSDPGAILAASDLFVLPSREEGMSLALLEAMALGMPVVASSIAGNQALVDDGRHGRLARPDDPQSLARAIVAQWSHPEHAAEQGRNARRRVLDHYSIAAVARTHLDLFNRLVAPASHR